MPYYGFLFAGLVMHIGDTPKGPKYYSALVWDDDHQQYLVFSEHDIVKLDRVPLIEIDGLPPNPAAQDASFEALVPNVSPIMGGTLEPRVRNATSNDVTFFRHVGGTLYAGFPYKNRARHIRTGLDGTKVVRDDDVAGLTLLILQTDATLRLRAGLVERNLLPDSLTIVANWDFHDPLEHDSSNDPHFRRYSKLTNFSNASITIDEYATAPRSSLLQFSLEPWIINIITNGLGMRTSTHSECGNSSWP